MKTSFNLHIISFVSVTIKKKKTIHISCYSQTVILQAVDQFAEVVIRWKDHGIFQTLDISTGIHVNVLTATLVISPPDEKLELHHHTCVWTRETVLKSRKRICMYCQMCISIYLVIFLLVGDPKPGVKASHIPQFG